MTIKIKDPMGLLPKKEQKRDTEGKYSKKNKGSVKTTILLFLIIPIVLSIIIVQYHSRKLSAVVVTPKTDKYNDIRESPEMKEQYELMVEEKGLMRDKERQDNVHTSSLAQLKADYDAKVASETADYKAKNDATEASLEGVRAKTVHFQ